MVSEINNNMNESLEKIKACIDNKRSFILEAGAGSGKTWSLIETLKYILESQSEFLLRTDRKIVCITFTNVAKDEISSRIYNNPLVLVWTIHEFLWDVIKNYQNELKSIIFEYNRNESKNPIESLENKIEDIKIEYSQYGRHLENGEITHDDVIDFSEKIFDKYPKISKILTHQYPYIFVDEYQDTEEKTVRLLINKVKNNFNNLIIGFFGDSWQKIYNRGIGSIQSDKLEFITKPDNFRCSISVINLLNKIRTDLVQKPSDKNLEGNISFFHCNNDLANNNNYNKVLEYLRNIKGWNFNVTKTKILLLTHKGIANKLDYENLLNVYNERYPRYGRERLYNNDELFSGLMLGKIEELSSLYKEKQYNEFIQLLGMEGFRLKKHADKERINALMNGLDEARINQNIGEVFNFIFQNKLLVKPQKMYDFEKMIHLENLDELGLKYKNFHEALINIKYIEVIRLYDYIKEHTPFSTKHGVKGAEFENVLMVIDDSAWNQYNFNNVFGDNRQNKERFKRTLNLLYVCCSRVKDKLALLSLSELENNAMVTIENWFGKKNIYDVSLL